MKLFDWFRKKDHTQAANGRADTSSAYGVADTHAHSTSSHEIAAEGSDAGGDSGGDGGGGD